MNFIINKFCELSAQYHFRFWVEHIKGKDNELADSLSRFKELYVAGQEPVQEFKYLPQQDLIEAANNVFAAFLNPKKVPLNDNDHRRARGLRVGGL